MAFLTARLVSVAFGAAGVLLVAWLAMALLPSRPRVAIGAAWFVVLLPAVPQYSAFVYNDALGFTASTARWSPPCWHCGTGWSPWWSAWGCWA